MPHRCPLCGAQAELPLTLLPERGMVVNGGRFVLLTPAESAVLTKLAEAFPRVVAKEAMMVDLYSMRHDDERAEDKIIDVFVCKLRKKVAPIGVSIETHWGRGYSLAVRPQIVSEGEAA